MKRIYFSILCLCLFGHVVANNDTTVQASNVTEAKESGIVGNINNNVTESNENQNSTGTDKTLENVMDNSNNGDIITNDKVSDNNDTQNSISDKANNTIVKNDNEEKGKSVDSSTLNETTKKSKETLNSLIKMSIKFWRR